MLLSALTHTEALERVTSLLHWLGVANVSDAVLEEPTTEMYQPCPQLQLYMHKVVPFVQKLLYSEHEDIYERLTAKNAKNKLAVLRFSQVRALVITALAPWGYNGVYGLDCMVQPKKKLIKIG